MVEMNPLPTYEIYHVCMFLLVSNTSQVVNAAQHVMPVRDYNAFVKTRPPKVLIHR